MYSGAGSALFAYELTILLIAVCGVVSSLEFLAIRGEFRRGGVFAWHVLSSRPNILRRRTVERAGKFVFDYRGTLVLLSLRLAAFALLPAMVTNAPAIRILTGVALVSSLFISFRNVFAGDGSDQMTVIVLIGLAVYAFGDDAGMRDLGLGFIAVQSVLSYIVAGVAKSAGAQWRRGTALRDILNTRTYGHRWAAASLSRLPGWLNAAFCWAIIGFELSFTTAFFLPAQALIVLLVLSLIFHALNAYFMGLNTFFWAFAASYPSIVYISTLTR